MRDFARNPQASGNSNNGSTAQPTPPPRSRSVNLALFRPCHSERSRNPSVARIKRCIAPFGIPDEKVRFRFASLRMTRRWRRKNFYTHRTKKGRTLYVLPDEGIYIPGRKSFEGVIGGTFPKVPPKIPRSASRRCWHDAATILTAAHCDQPSGRPRYVGRARFRQKSTSERQLKQW